MTLDEEIRALAAKVSNWGRWGPDDELGTLNFITPEKRREAAALVRKGVTFPFPMIRPVTDTNW